MPKDSVELKNGKLVSSRVTDKVVSTIEKGPLVKVDALVVHQSGGPTAESSLQSYRAGRAGAHFLIDKDGTIYQTARVDRKCWHVGNIRSRCSELKTCTPEELAQIKSILFKKGEAYSTRIKDLHRHESDKPYPERYPNNDDALGIELVGNFSAGSGTGYETVTEPQNLSLQWLVAVLEQQFDLGDKDIYRHPEVSYKQASEAASARWSK